MSLRDDLLEAHGDGSFLEAVNSHASADRDTEGLALELVALHNEGLVDVVEAFRSLDPNAAGVDYFLTRSAFEQALPDLEAAVPPVQRCVLHLLQGAGRDLAAGHVVVSYESYCEKDRLRPQQALAEIEADPGVLAPLLPATLIAGSRVDRPAFLGHAMRLSEHDDLALRRQAIFSMSKLDWPEDQSVSESAFALLERLAETEVDDQALAAIVHSGFAFLQQQRVAEPRVVAVIEATLKRGADLTLHSAAELLASHAAELPDAITALLMEHLPDVEPGNRGTVDVIDHGIWRLLDGGETQKAIGLLETLLLRHSDEFTMDVFDGASARIAASPELIGRIATRWFLRGDRVLGDAVHGIIASHVLGDLPLEIDPEELGVADHAQTVFLAGKVIGFLFTQPITAASLLLSLMQHAPDDQTLTDLGALLYDALLLNYTGRVRDYVAQAPAEPVGVRAVLDNALERLEQYLEGLRSAGELPALHPMISQREAYNRHFSRQMEESWRAAKAQSPLLSLFGTSVLLYGRASITYVHGADGQTHRTESPLHAHETEMEIPRMQTLDPYELDMMLRVFRNAQMTR